MDFKSNLNLCKNELQNPRLHNLTSDPASAVEGQLYYNSASKRFLFNNGSGFVAPVLATVADTITVQHTFNPGTASAPFILGANASGQLVTGLNSDLLEGQHGAYYLNPANFDALTANRALISNASGKLAVSVVTNVELGYVSGVTSAIQTQLNAKLDKGGGFMTGFITLHADPVNALHAVTKQYVDNLKQGLDTKDSCRVATTTNLAWTYSGTPNFTLTSPIGVQTIDNIADLVLDDRVLVKNQSTGTQNGIYKVTQVGTATVPMILTRAEDFDSNADVTAGAYTYVVSGTVGGATGWVLSTAGAIVLDTTAITFTQFSGAGAIVPGDGLTQTGNIFNVAGTTNRITVTADAVDIASTYVGQSSITTLGTITAGVWQGTSVKTEYGGTGLTAYTAGDMLYYASGSSLSKVGIGSAGKMMRSTGTAPAWSTTVFADTYAINTILFASGANNVTGLATANSSVLVTNGTGVPSLSTDLPTAVTIGGQYIHRVGGADVAVADGGTGKSSWTQYGVVFASGTTTLADTGAGIAGQPLLAGGTGNPAWGTLGLTYGGTNANLSAVATGGLIYKGASALAGTGALTGVLKGNGASAPSAMTGTTGYNVYWSDANTLGSEQYAATSRGGTGTGTAPTQGGIIYGASATAYGSTGAGTTKQLLSSNGSSAPAWITPDMSYLPDATLKKSVKCATTANLGTVTATTTTLTNAGTLQAFPAQDGITLAQNDRILVKDQSSPAQNGIYYLSTVGTASVAWVLTRVADADAITELASSLVAVDSGTINGGLLFDNDTKITDTLGTTAINWYTVADNAKKLSFFSATTSAELAGVISDETGSGLLVFATSPTLTTPVLGVASATSINKVAITAPATSATLTLANGSTLATSGAYSITLTSTAGTNVTLPTTGTLATLAGTETLSNKTLTAPKFVNDGYIADANGNELITLNTTANAVNNIAIANGASGTSPVISAVGNSTDIGISFIPKGIGGVAIFSGATDNSGLSVAADYLTRGASLYLSSASTAGTASNSSKMLQIDRSGANINASHVAYGVHSSVVNTGTTSTNIAGYFNASGATNNYGLIVEAGYVGFGVTTPTHAVEVSGDIQYTGQLISTVAIGTAPFSITSTTVVPNLNASLLEGHNASYFATATHTQAVDKGGTNITSYASGDMIYASGTTTLSKLNKGTGNQLLGMNNGATAPEYKTISGTSAGTAGTAGNIVITHAANSINVNIGQNVVTLNDNQILSNKTLTAPKFADNGYIADINGNALVSFYGTASAVNHLNIVNGSANNPVELWAEGTDTNISIYLTPKGTGSVDVTNSKITNVTDPTNAQDAATKAYVDAQRDTRVRKVAFNNVAGTSADYVHNLNTLDVEVQFREINAVAPHAYIMTDYEAKDVNTITVRFAIDPGADKIRIIVMG